MGQLVAAHRLEPRRAPLRERRKGLAAPRLHAVRNRVAHCVEVARLDALRALREALHERGVAHRGIPHRLAEPGAPDPVEDCPGESRVDQDGGRLAADRKRVLDGGAVHCGGIGERRVDHRRRGGRHSYDLDAPARLRSRIPRKVEDGSAAEGDHRVVRADPGVDERGRDERRALQAVGLDLLAARHHHRTGGERYAVRLEILSDPEPEPLGALHDVRVGHKRDPGRRCAGDGPERVGERRVPLVEDVFRDFDRILSFSLFSSWHFRAFPRHVFLSRS